MMKKQYISPVVELIGVALQQVVAVSGIDKKSSPAKYEDEVLSRQVSPIWDDEVEE